MDFFDNPDVLTSGVGYKGEPSTFLELTQSVAEQQEKVRNHDAVTGQLIEAFDRRDDELEKAGLGRLGNPFRRQRTPEESDRIRRAMIREGDDLTSSVGKPLFMNPQMDDAAAAYFLREYDEQLKALQEKRPDLAHVIRAEKPPAAEVGERLDAIERRASEAQESRNRAYSWLNPYRVVEGTAANLAGTLYGQRTSPVDMAANLVGMANRPWQSIFKNYLKAAASNMAVQAMLSPSEQAARAAVGLESGLGVALQDIAMSGLVGGAFDTAFRAPVRAINKARGVEGLGGIFRDAPNPEGTIPVPRPQAEGQAPAEPVVPTHPVDLDADLLRRAAEGGDPAAMREIIDKLKIDITDEPELRGALAAAEREQVVPITVEGVDDGTGVRHLSRMLLADLDNQEPRPRAPDALPEPRTPFDLDRAIRTAQDPEAVRFMDGARTALDTAEPGLSVRVEALIEAGHPAILDAMDDAVKRARGTEDAAKAADQFVKDVLSLRNEIGPERFDAQAAIYSGQASPLDVARAYRAMPDLLDRSAGDHDAGRMAQSLARLSDTAFRMVERGEADPLIAQVVSDFVDNPGLHASLLDDLKRAGVPDPDTARRTLNDLIPPARDPDAIPLDAGSKMDDPAGPEAKAQVERLKAEYATEMTEHAAKLQARKAQAEAAAQIEQAKQEAIARADAVRAAIEAESAMGGTTPVRVFTSFGDLPPEAMGDVMRGNASYFAGALRSYIGALSDEARAAAIADMERAVRQQGIEGFYRDGTVWLAAYADNPNARYVHEMVHALVDAGQLTRAEVRELAALARKSGIFDPLREAIYARAYADRGSRLPELLDEEAAAHLLEAKRTGALPETVAPPDVARADGIVARIQAFMERIADRVREAIGLTKETEATSSASSILDQLLSGEIAQRERVARAMQGEDITAMAVRDGGMFALRDQIDRSREPELDGLPKRAPQASGPAPRLDDAVLRTAIEREIEKMLPADVTARVVDGLLASDGLDSVGHFDPSRMQPDPRTGLDVPSYLVEVVMLPTAAQTLAIGRHETIHALRTIGLFRKPEWDTLVAEARRLGVREQDTMTDPATGREIPILEAYDKLYRDFYTQTGAQGEQLEAVVTEYLNQERVAGLAEFWQRGGPVSETTRALLDRALAVLQALGRAMSQLGITSLEQFATARRAELVGDRVMGGDIGRRSTREPPVGGGIDQPMFAFADSQTGRDMRRSLDALGYYSQALEAAHALKQAKGTPEQMLAQIKSAGVKDAEIEATGLRGFLDGKQSVTRDEIVGHLEQSRIKLNLSTYRKDAIAPSARGAIDNPTRDPVAWARSQIALRMIGTTQDAISQARAATLTDIDDRIASLRNQSVGERLSSLFNREQLALHRAELEALQRARLEVQSGRADPTLPDPAVSAGVPKWGGYSLDPSNPTYRETVLHLPESVPSFDEYLAARIKKGTAWESPSPDNLATYRADYERGDWRNERSRDYVPVLSAQDTNFRSGHFPEPNIVGHMMTSMTTHQGKPVYTIDQIQSDWGQKLRDGGVRDEAKIAELQKRADETDPDPIAVEASQWLANAVPEHKRLGELTADQMMSILNEESAGKGFTDNQDVMREAAEWSRRIDKAARDNYLVWAELSTAQAAASGHPLVNTTDQWVNTTLRRAITQAAEADAQYIAIPSGDTVLSYNPGDTEGMRGFYDKIVPKNLKNILAKLDKDSPAPQRIDTLDSPSGKTGLGKGFTLFPLTDTVKREVTQRGQAMFAFAGERAKTADKDVLALAKKMEAEGPPRVLTKGAPGYEAYDAHRRRVWDATNAMGQGWFLPIDGKWRFEIDDSGLRTSIGEGEGLLNGPMQHPALAQAYPEGAANLDTKVGWWPEKSGAYSSPDENGFAAADAYAATTARRRSVAAHELQHFVQNQEGIDASGPTWAGWLGYGRYLKNWREVEARAVQKRLDMSPEERKARPPWLDYDVPEDQQIVRFADGRADTKPDDGPMFAFAGVKASTAPRDMLKLAERMESRSRKPADIFKNTGWFRGHDKLWRFEIDDSNALLHDLDAISKPWTNRPKGAPEEKGLRIIDSKPLKSVLDHPALYAAYPYLEKMPVRVIYGENLSSDLNETGAFRIKTTGNQRSMSVTVWGRSVIEVHRALLHELQHYIQTKEGWDAGSNPKAFTPGGIDPRRPNRGTDLFPITRGESMVLWHEEKLNELARDHAEGRMKSLSEDELLRSINREAAKRMQVGTRGYSKSPGEAEANLAMDRGSLTANERRDTFPMAKWPTDLDPAAPMQFGKWRDALDAAQDSLARTKGYRKRYFAPRSVGDHTVMRKLEGADRTEDWILFDHTDDAGKADVTVEVREHPFSGHAEWRGVRGNSDEDRFMAMSPEERTAFVDNIERGLRERNLQLIVNTDRMMADEAGWWWSRNPNYGEGDPRFFLSDIEDALYAKHGSGVSVQPGNGYGEDWTYSVTGLLGRKKQFNTEEFGKVTDVPLHPEDLWSMINQVREDRGEIDSDRIARDYKGIDRSIVESLRRSPDGGLAMFALADQSSPDEVARLTDRLSMLASGAGAQVPDLQARVSSALNLIATVRETAADRGVELPDNAVEIAQAGAARGLTQLLGVLGPERTAQIADDLAVLTKDLPSDPQEIAARLNAVLDQYFPDEPKMAANDNADLGPMSPVETEMFNMERMGAILELIGVCRG